MCHLWSGCFACPMSAHLQDKSIDELTRFIDGGSKKGKAKKKKGKEEEERPIITDAAPNRPVFPEGTRWMLPLGWMDPAEDAAAHLRCWRELGQCELTAVVEANRYLRLQLQPADKNRLLSTPGSCVLAFPRHDAVKRMSDTEMLQGSNVQFFSTLLNVFVFSNDELRDPGKEGKCPPPEVSKGNLVFELLVRQRDCLTPPPLRFSSGPCIPKSRVDMSRTVQWTEPELVQMRVDGREEPVIRMRWWINVEVLQVVCKSNLIDCTGLERTDVEPFEWLCCVYDDGFPGAPALQECNWAFRHGLKGPAVPPVLPAPAASPAAAAAAAAAPPAETKAAEEADLEELSCSSNSSRTLALPAKLVHFWCDLVGKELPYIAKADSYVHFDVRMTSTGREVIPEHWIVAFVEREKSEKSKARYHTGLLNLNIIPESSVPEGYLASAQELDPNAKGPRDYLHFELLLRESDTAQPLCITAGLAEGDLMAANDSLKLYKDHQEKLVKHAAEEEKKIFGKFPMDDWIPAQQQLNSAMGAADMARTKLEPGNSKHTNETKETWPHKKRSQKKLPPGGLVQEGSQTQWFTSKEIVEKMEGHLDTINEEAAALIEVWRSWRIREGSPVPRVWVKEWYCNSHSYGYRLEDQKLGRGWTFEVKGPSENFHCPDPKFEEFTSLLRKMYERKLFVEEVVPLFKPYTSLQRLIPGRENKKLKPSLLPEKVTFGPFSYWLSQAHSLERWDRDRADVNKEVNAYGDIYDIRIRTAEFKGISELSLHTGFRRVHFPPKDNEGDQHDPKHVPRKTCGLDVSYGGYPGHKTAAINSFMTQFAAINAKNQSKVWRSEKEKSRGFMATGRGLCGVYKLGPVRENPSTKHRESMRIDLGRSVRQIQKDVVEKSGKRLNRNSWYVCIETLRLVATCNGLDCSGLDDAKAPPVQWVIVLCDEQLEQSAETRSIEDLLDFIDGKADDALRELKEPKPAPPDPERVKATAVALFDLMSSLGAGRPEEKADRPTAASAARAAAEAAAAAASGDPVAQVKAAAELLAQAAAQSNSPRKFAAALAAAQLAAEPYGMARRCKSRARLHWALPTAGLVLVLQLCWAPVGWAIANGAPRGRGMTAVQQSVKHRERTVVRNNWVDEFQDFRDSGYDVAKLMLKKAQEKGKGDRLLAASRTLSEGDNNAAAGALHAIRDLLGSQEGILQRELTGLRTQLSALDTRFSQVQERLQESEEREGLLGKRLTAALKQERELKFALETARQQYESVSEELEGLQDSETKLKRQVQELVQREQDLKNADVVRPKDLEEMESLRKERDQLVMRLQQLEQEGKDYGRELAESQKREVALQAALDNSTEQMAELITALTESRAREAELQGQLSAALEREQSMSIDLQESQKREQQLTKELEDQAQLLADALSSQEQLAERLDETLRKATSVAADLTASRKHEVALMKELKDSMDREEQLKNELEAVARPVS
eukprot:symbB.v1.2.019468.t2/scaffold1593.1/size164412/10